MTTRTSFGPLVVPVLSLFIALTNGQSTCGSLVTYRQYSTLLTEAPNCLRNGCGGIDSATSMSSSCPQQAPCSEIWNLLEGQYQKDWCESCEDDVACRIAGWPVLNATAACDMSPNAWLFGAQGECCASGDEPFELADWVGSLCNGSEWREAFNRSGWMAKEDWEEWILPWNWTVAPNNIDLRTGERLPAVCDKSPWYLGLFFIENLFFLACAVGFGLVRLLLIKRQELKALNSDHLNDDPQRTIIYRLLWLRPGPGSHQIVTGSSEHLQPRETDSRLHPGWLTQSFLGPYLPLIVGILLAGLQVLVNMGSAYVIKHYDGYNHVPAAKLGLLFCSRPRLTWFASALGLWRNSLPKKHFKLRHGRAAATAVLAGVAVSSTVSEGIMQAISVYNMGLTANSGREKGFYAPKHLTPYTRGQDARHMYLGALFWLIAAVPIIFIWPITAYFSNKIFGSLHALRMRLARILPNSLRPRRHRHDEDEDSDAESLLQQRRLIFMPHPADFNLLGIDGSEQNGRGDIGVGEMQQLNVPQNRHLRGGNESRSSFDSSMMQQLANAPTNHAGPSTTHRPGAIRGGDGKARYEYQSVRQVSGGSTDYSYGPSTTRRPGPIRVGDGRGNYEYSSVRQVSGGSDHYNTRQVSTNSDDYSYDHFRDREALRNPSGARLRGGLGRREDDSDDDDGVPDYRPKKSYEEWQGTIIGVGLTIGLISYAAQWLFWDGYVKASGPRFCHPELLSTGTLWAVGSVLSKFLSLKFGHIEILIKQQLRCFRFFYSRDWVHSLACFTFFVTKGAF